MSQSIASRASYAEYLAIEARSEEKHEFIDGVVHAMAGGTPEHARIITNVIGVLRDRLAGRPCQVFTSDLRVRVLATGLATYPDASVFCERLERHPEDDNAGTNPIVLIEVLSPRTESYDREDKFAHYRRIATLRAYVLVAQEEQRVEVYHRNTDESWTLRWYESGDAVIEALGCALRIDDVYRDPLATG